MSKPSPINPQPKAQPPADAPSLPRQRPRLTTLPHRVPTLDTRRGLGVAIDRIRGGQLTRIRERILQRDTYTCQRCGRVGTDLEIDHIIPLALGGQEHDANRQALCRDCHARKSAEEEQARGMAPR